VRDYGTLFCFVIVVLPFMLCTQRREPHWIFLLLPRREFVLSVQARIKTLAAASPNYLLGAGIGHAFCFFIV